MTLNKTIPEIQDSLSQVTDVSVFEDLLAQEKKGKKRKVLKRWLRERIKTFKRITRAHPGAEIHPSGVAIYPPPNLRRPPKDPITGIPIIG